MIFDFHTHTTLSDGGLCPMELIHSAVRKGYGALGITDHVGVGQLERFISELKRDCALAEKYWDIRIVPGVELTHLPPEAISDAARMAKGLGAELVVVHGETIAEDVPQGSNMAAARSAFVDVIAHPGLIAADVARVAKENGVYLEISARKGHCLTNGHVAQVARANGAGLLLGSDAHTDGDLLSADRIPQILRGAGLTESEIEQACRKNPHALLARLGRV